MPRMDATDRSISPLMMISVIGSVMIAISPLDRPKLKRLLLVRNCGDTDAPTMAMITTTTHPARGRAFPPLATPSAGPASDAQRQRRGSSSLPRAPLTRSAAVSRTEMNRSTLMARMSRKPQMAWSQNGEMPRT